MAARRCVLFFARSPRAETRTKKLAGAEPFFAAAAERVAEAARQAGFDLLVASGGPPPKVEARRAVAQRGRGFAERLRNAFADAHALGYEQIVAVPGDVPGLDPALLAQAATALDEGRIVLGPSPDGGVYLLGLAGEDWASALEGVRWQTSAVFRDLLSHARNSGVEVLRVLADVDRLRDLDRIAREGGVDPGLVRLIRTIRRRPALRPCAHEGPRRRAPGLGVEPLRGPPCPPA